jgi:hypothetical protein
VISLLPLPFPTAVRLNFLSVLCGAFGAALLYLMAVKILENWVEDKNKLSSRILVHGGAFVSGIIPAFLYTSWSNSTEAEVYATATATIILCAWLMFYMGSMTDQKHMKNVLLLVIYIVSLSIGNHLIILLVAPAVVVYTLIHDRRNWRYWISILGCFLGLYLLVLKGINNPAVAERLHQASSSNAGVLVALYRHVAAFLDVIFGFYKYVDSWPAMFLGFLIAIASILWAWRQKALSFFAMALGLFLLGFSIHLFLLIRSGLNPPINEGQPDNLKALWAVIGREQYGSAYGILPRQVWAMATGKSMVASVSDLTDNILYYFKYNIPFYTKYFGWQYGNAWITAVFAIIGIFGAWKHYASEKKSFFFWLTVFLVTGPILNTYLNFKFGFTQARDLFPDDNFHEPRERDYFFIVSFIFFGFWSGLGLAAILDKLRRTLKMGTDHPGLGQVPFAFLGLAVFLPALLPVYINYEKADRSGNFFPRTYARNIMNSLEPGAILFTNGDNDTFPLWYIQEVEGVRKDCRVVNLSLLNTNWYIKQMRDQEPKVPISWDDAAVEKMRPYQLDRDMQSKILEITFKKDFIMYVKDIMVLDILRTNKWKKPIYFTTTVPESNRSGLSPYLTLNGAVYKVNPRKAADLAAADSNIFPYNPEANIYLDIKNTQRLLYEVYKFDSFFGGKGQDEEVNNLAPHFSLAFNALGQAFIRRGQYDRALPANLMARMFAPDPHQYDYLVAMLYTINKKYNEANLMMDSLVQFRKEGSIPVLYQRLAQEAVNSGDNFEAAGFLEKALKIDPGFKGGYANLFQLYNAAGNKEKAIEYISSYLNRFPEDQAVKEELRRYRETGQFDLQKTFGVPR